MNLKKPPKIIKKKMSRKERIEYLRDKLDKYSHDKFCKEMCDIICQEIAKGYMLSTVAGLVKLDPRTILRWLREGKTFKSEEKHSFYLQYEQARAKAETKYLNVIESALDDIKNWQAAVRRLEWIAPEKYKNNFTPFETMSLMNQKLQAEISYIKARTKAIESLTNSPEGSKNIQLLINDWGAEFRQKKDKEKEREEN